MDANREQFLWVEKYRPRKLEDCILPDHQKETFRQILVKGEMPNMLLCGGAGVGKTTIARALCEELNVEYIVINGSQDNGIDLLRTSIKSFASTVSFESKKKVIILDEADYLSPNMQAGLRGFIEEFSNNCRFIFTCNFKNKIIAPLHSRTTVIEFKLAKTEKQQMAAQFFKRALEILKEENVTVSDPKVLAKLIEKHFPDYRRCLNELQRYSVGGVIDEGVLVNLQEVNLKELIDALKEKDFRKMRQWVANNIDSDPQTIFRKLYDGLDEHVKQVPQLILLLADYQYKAAFVADHELNLVACLTEIMAAVEFK